MLPPGINFDTYAIQVVQGVGPENEELWTATVSGPISAPESGHGENIEAALRNLVRRLAYRLDDKREELMYQTSGRGLYNPVPSAIEVPV